MNLHPVIAQALAPHMPAAWRYVNEPEALLCLDCSGSGEGRNDGSTCRACKGMGEIEVTA